MIQFLQSLVRCVDVLEVFANQLYFVAFPLVEGQAAAIHGKTLIAGRQPSATAQAERLKRCREDSAHAVSAAWTIYSNPDPNVNARNSLQRGLYWNRFASYYLGWYENTLRVTAQPILASSENCLVTPCPPDMSE
jgi:hypothetical protein